MRRGAVSRSAGGPHPSNRTRGFRKARGFLVLAGPDVSVPDTDRAPLALRRTWARPSRKVYAVDPLVCPRCGATMQIIAVIDHAGGIYRILSHLNRLSPGDGPRAPPQRGVSSSATQASTGLTELISEPVLDALPWPAFA